VPELTAEQVAALAAAIGLPLTPEDLAEVTHRLNALVDALAPLGELPLETVEPVPGVPDEPLAS
jgi:Asp-tRNA(Asn)/Glu-tRNA(Gln) amidotransferase C subunit